ncbi:MAG: transposase [Nostoc sp. ChiQUE02]|uniref:transposase n=1 Tax=Nostoc sp. ChiQUE02 TaxID=3075377 RepID=UPI003D1616BC
MRPGNWQPQIELSALEQSIVKRIKRAKLFTFLRQCRHQLFNEEFQEELSKLYADSAKGHPPVPPAQLALATILQAYTGASDAEAIEALSMDRRWQLVLDCIDCENAPFSQATLVRFRTALIIHGLDLVQAQPENTQHPQVRSAIDSARLIEAQDVEVDTNGEVKLLQGVAKERRISIEDEEMRHGRKSKSQRFDGYKRHVLRDLDNGLVRAVGITRANIPEASVTDTISNDLKYQKVNLVELHIDRAYLSSSLVQNRTQELTVYCKAWQVRNGLRFTKTAFILDWDNQTICCPNQVTLPFSVGGKVQFPKNICATCPVRERCTNSKTGRSVSIHPDEPLFRELKQRQLTPVGRAKLRERVAVEHSLSHIGHWQGDQARYVGSRKNLFDLRRTAVVHNLHVLAKNFTHATEQSATSS